MTDSNEGVKPGAVVRAEIEKQAVFEEAPPWKECGRQYSYSKDLDAVCEECGQPARHHRVPFDLGQLMKLLDSSFNQGVTTAAAYVIEQSTSDGLHFVLATGMRGLLK